MRHSPKSIDDWLREQRGLLAVWQLKADGHSRAAIRHRTDKLREVHRGVYLSGHAPLSDWQAWKAATLTAPGTWLSDWSAASFQRVRERADRMPTTVCRVGSGGIERSPARPGRLGSVVVRRSSNLAGQTTILDGIPCIWPGRTLLDLLPSVGQLRAGHMVRDVLRLKVATSHELWLLIAQHRGVRGVDRLRALMTLYGDLPADDANSDPEIVGLALLKAAGLPLPELNVVIAGVEADFVYRDRKLIVELDGPQYHQFAVEEARKTAAWEGAGFTVRRLPTDDVYYRPRNLLDAATAPTPHELGLVTARSPNGGKWRP